MQTLINVSVLDGPGPHMFSLLYNAIFLSAQKKGCLINVNMPNFASDNFN